MAMRNPETAHWRDSARTPQLFIIDAYAIFPMILFLLHIRLWTLYVTLLTTIFFVIVRKFGFTVPVFLRFLRAWIAGSRRVAYPWWTRRYWY